VDRARFLFDNFDGFRLFFFYSFWVVFRLGIVFGLFGGSCGLKDEFCGENKGGILGFWTGKKKYRRVFGLL